MKTFERKKGKFLITTDKRKLQIDFIHHWLSCESYWARNISRDAVKRVLRYSLCFGVFDGVKQIGFAKVVTDFTTTAYVGDVFIIADYRGRKLGQWLMNTMIAHPELQGLRRWILATRDAHGLYAKSGFKPLAKPERWMERYKEDAYK